jgi:hypothetical protein
MANSRAARATGIFAEEAIKSLRPEEKDNMKKKNEKKLNLNRESLRQLTSKQNRVVVGGVILPAPDSNDPSQCATICCQPSLIPGVC